MRGAGNADRTHGRRNIKSVGAVDLGVTAGGGRWALANLAHFSEMRCQWSERSIDADGNQPHSIDRNPLKSSKSVDRGRRLLIYVHECCSSARRLRPPRLLGCGLVCGVKPSITPRDDVQTIDRHTLSHDAVHHRLNSIDSSTPIQDHHNASVVTRGQRRPRWVGDLRSTGQVFKIQGPKVSLIESARAIHMIAHIPSRSISRSID